MEVVITIDTKDISFFKLQKDWSEIRNKRNVVFWNWDR